MEDPIEFVHPHKNCIVTQREVGLDTDSWEAALKSTLRQAPDVILMGEIRDRETMEHAIVFCRDRSPVHGHLARQQRQPGARPHRELLPRRAARAIAAGFVAEPARHDLAAPDAARRTARAAWRRVEVLLNTPLISDLIAKGDVVEIKEIMQKEP